MKSNQTNSKRTMKTKHTHLAALACASLIGTSAMSQAATISWSSTAFLTDGTTPWAFVEGQFATTGTQIFAENSGGGSRQFWRD